MRLALISDIHGNLPALESVLTAIRDHAPDQILSLGDQVNLGPSPKEVLALLRENNVTCLHGNHERYILSVMAGDPGYDGANFDFLRYHTGILTPEEITFPKELRMGNLVFTHAMPGDDRFPVFHVKQCMELLKQMEFPEAIHIFCGHGHNPRQYRAGNLTLNVVGSVGCMDDGVPGAAPFTIVDVDGGATAVHQYFAQYDVSRLPALFRASGMVDHCPIMSHIACLQSMTNREYLMLFAARANALAKEKGEPHVSKETWAQIDREFDWPDGIGTKEFWEIF